MRTLSAALITVLLVTALSGTILFANVGNADSVVNEWSMFHYDQTHSGCPDNATATGRNFLWSYKMGSRLRSHLINEWSSPAVVGGIVYVGSRDFNVYALNASTGAKIWNYTTGNAVFSSPAVVGGVVYIGSWDCNVYALNAYTGTKIWNYTTGAIVDSSPAVSDGIVYVGSGYPDSSIYALNALTGAKIWSYKTGNAVYASPTVVDGMVYVGSDDHNVYALDAYSGVCIWSYTTDWSVESSPAVVDGVVYVGSGAYDCNVYALNAYTGAKIWNYKTGMQVLSSPAVTGGVVYIGADDGNVYALNAATGAFVWSYKTSGQVNAVFSSPAVVGGIVYVGSCGGNVYVLDAATGWSLWNYTINRWVMSSPAVAGSSVFVVDVNDVVYAFGGPATPLPPPLPPPPPPPPSLQVVSSTGDGGGRFSSLALDSKGSPHISFVDNSNGDLKYASWTSSGWTVQTVDPAAGRVGYLYEEYCSLALDSNDRPHICYEANYFLKYAEWTDSGWKIQTVDSGGGYCSLALDSSGNPRISYLTGYFLRYASWNGTRWKIQTVDSALNVGVDTSLALDSNGNPRISYRDSNNMDLKYAAWNGTSWNIQTVDSEGNVGSDPSLDLDSKDNPHISYYGGGLKYAVWNDSGWNIQTIAKTPPSGYAVGLSPSLKLDPSDNAHIAYYDARVGHLKLAVQAGSSWAIQTVDLSRNVGWSTSLALDAHGNTHISYYDGANHVLKYIELDSSGRSVTPPTSSPLPLPLPSSPAPPSVLADPPIITISNPQNTTYSMTNLTLSFNITIGKIVDSRISMDSIGISNVYYKGDWQPNETYLGHEFLFGNTVVFSCNLTGIPEGARRLVVHATESVADPDLPTISNVDYQGSLSVSFTINTPPNISILSPEAKAYKTSAVALNFTVNELASRIAYSLDGEANVTILGNVTLTGLSNGAHNIIVYAWDNAGNIGSSETIHFSVSQPTAPFPTAPFPTALVAVTFVLVAAVSVGLILFFLWKRNH